MKNNTLLTLGILGLTIGTGAGLSSTTLYTQASELTTNEEVDSSMVQEAKERRGRLNISEEKLAKREAVKEAMENKDYGAWKNAIEDSRKSEDLLSKIDTREKFDKLAEAKQIMQSARAESEAILEELGLEKRQSPRARHIKSDE